MKKINYTEKMYQYLAWRLFQEVYNMVEWQPEEEKTISGLVKQAREKLTDDEIKIAENRAMRMKNDYEATIAEEYVPEEFDNDNFFPQIDYNQEFYEIWKEGVANRLTVKMKYDSTTSGIGERLVDPYKSRAPYGEGYCHKRQEVRKFRFDRVIDIKLTDKKFEKKKDKE